MDNLKLSDLYKGKMGLLLAVLAIATVVMLVIKLTGIADISYTVALMPLGCDVMIAVIFLIVMIF